MGERRGFNPNSRGSDNDTPPCVVPPFWRRRLPCGSGMMPQHVGKVCTLFTPHPLEGDGKSLLSLSAKTTDFPILLRGIPAMEPGGIFSFHSSLPPSLCRRPAALAPPRDKAEQLSQPLESPLITVMFPAC
jgi:hypothetical protein